MAGEPRRELFITQEEVQRELSNLSTNLRAEFNQQLTLIPQYIEHHTQRLHDELTQSIENYTHRIFDEFNNTIQKFRTDIVTSFNETLTNRFHDIENQIEENNNNNNTILEEFKSEIEKHFQNTTTNVRHNNFSQTFLGTTNARNSTSTYGAGDSRNQIKPPTYDGSGPWSQFYKQFEMTANYNGWTEQTKTAQLVTCLRDKARVILNTTPDEVLYNFERLKEALDDRFGEQKYAHMYEYELETRKQKKEENIIKFAEEIETLTNCAHHELPTEQRNEIACKQFIKGLWNTRIATQLRAERIKNIREAMQRATEWKAIFEIERLTKNEKQQILTSTPSRSGQNPSFNNTGNFKNNNQNYNKNYSSQFKPRNITNNQQKTCRNCGETGHLSFQCQQGNQQQNNRNFQRPRFYQNENRTSNQQFGNNQSRPNNNNTSNNNQNKSTYFTEQIPPHIPHNNDTQNRPFQHQENYQESVQKGMN